MAYYLCVLTTGKKLDFNKKGERIEWTNDMFRVLNENGVAIAIIPVFNVSHFLRVVE